MYNLSRVYDGVKVKFGGEIGYITWTMLTGFIVFNQSQGYYNPTNGQHCRINMLYPIAIEKGSNTTAFGVVIPDLPGCFSAGDSFEEALLNAKVAINMHLETLAELDILPPQATTIDSHYDKPEFKDWVWPKGYESECPQLYVPLRWRHGCRQGG